MRDKLEIAKDIFAVIKKAPEISAQIFFKLDDVKMFEPLHEAGLFDQSLLPPVQKSRKGGFYQPFWPQFIFLEFVVKELNSKDLEINKDIAKLLKEIIFNLIALKDDNLTTKQYTFRLFSLLPLKDITVNEINWIFSYVNHEGNPNAVPEYTVLEGFGFFAEKASSGKHDLECFKAYLFQMFNARSQESKKTDREKLLFFNSYSFNDFWKEHFNLEDIKKNKPFLLEDSLNVFVDLLEDMLENEDIDGGSQYWRPAIEEHHQNEFHDSAQSLYAFSIFNIARCMADSESKIDTFIDKIRSSEYISLRRIYLALATRCSGIVDINIVGRDLVRFGLKSSIRYEGFHFLKEHFDSLETEVQELILKSIDNLQEEYADNNEEKQIFVAWKKIRWAQSLKESKSPEAIKLFEQYKEITGSESDHPEFSSYMEVGWTGSKSPWTIEDFNKATPEEILKKLIDFNGTDEFKGPSIEGLSRKFEEYVKEDPFKCSKIFPGIKDLQPIYISSLFLGYTESFRTGKFVTVKRLLETTEALVKDDLFWQKKETEDSKVLWAVNSILRFIQEGMRDDEKAFNPEVNTVCLSIIKELYKRVEPTGKQITPSDAYTNAINEPRGVLFETMILWALRVARLSGEKDEHIKSGWNDISFMLEKTLYAQNNEEQSLHAILGAFYRQVSFLNKNWIEDNLNRLIPMNKDCEPLFMSFMEGYSYVTTFVPNMYKKLASMGALLKFLRYEEDKNNNDRLERLQGRVIEFSIIAYVLDIETLSSGIMGEVLKEKKPDEISKLIRSLAPVTKKDKDPKHKDKVKELVIHLLNEHKKNGRILDYNESFIGAAKLLEAIDDINEPAVNELIEIVVMNSEQPWELSELIYYLYEFVDNYPDKVGNLLYESLVKCQHVPVYPMEKVKYIFKKVSETGDKVLLSKLVTLYKNKAPETKFLQGY